MGDFHNTRLRHYESHRQKPARLVLQSKLVYILFFVLDPTLVIVLTALMVQNYLERRDSYLFCIRCIQTHWRLF